MNTVLVWLRTAVLALLIATGAWAQPAPEGDPASPPPAPGGPIAEGAQPAPNEPAPSDPAPDDPADTPAADAATDGTTPPPVGAAPPADRAPGGRAVDPGRSARDSVRVGQDLVVGPDEVVGDAVVVLGDARIAGTVRELVVIMGTLDLLEGANVRSLVAVGGDARVAPGVRVAGDMVMVGGTLQAPADFRPGGEHVVVGVPMMGAAVATVLPWVNRGLLWGRPLVPDLAWMWALVGVLFLVYAAIVLMFERPVRLAAGALEEKPLTAFGAGVLVVVLAGPLVMLLAISVIGLLAVPFLVVALVAVALVGRVATIRWIGMRVLPEGESESRVPALRSVALGFVLLCLLYLVPVVGFLAWALVGIFGLGAASMALVAAYRRENPVPPPLVIPHPPDGGASAAPSEGAPEGAPATGAGSRAGVSLLRDDGVPPPAGGYAAPEPTTEGEPPGARAATTFAASGGGAPGAGTTVTGGVASPGGPSPGAPLSGGPSPAGAGLLAYPLASFGDRLLAGVLDLILVGILARLLWFRGPNMLLFLLLVYLIAFWAWKHTTVGGIICHLRVTRVDGTPLRFGDALIRGLSSLFSMAVLGLGFLWILKDPERQSWHDKIAGTYVVKVPRHLPL